MPQGTIKKLVSDKGFGFIVAADGGGDVFLPLAVLERSGFGQAPEGATVTFDCAQGAKGRAAVAVINIDASTAQASRPHPRDRGGESRGPAESLDGVVKNAMPMPAVKWDVLAERLSESVDAQAQRERFYIGNWLRQPMRLAYSSRDDLGR